jgi:imidazole glycerol-phosphate synthase subunit HisH
VLTIIDYNAGNIASIQNMLKKLGQTAIITSDPEEVLDAEKIILPGVGAFDYGMENLNQYELTDSIKQKAQNGTPMLGICLGAQLLGHSSEEGNLQGLGLIDMSVIKFSPSKLPTNCKIPHMGWNEIQIKKKHPIFRDMYRDPRFYFVHSYHFVTGNTNDILTTSMYGYEFVSSFQHENIIGVQFHPEKSHKFGMKLLENFIKM